jgi:hypothetical protein
MMVTAIYLNVNPKANGAETPLVLTVEDVPVDGFWSVAVYDKVGFFEPPEAAASLNNVTAKKDADGGVTIHFGGDLNAQMATVLFYSSTAAGVRTKFSHTTNCASLARVDESQNRPAGGSACRRRRVWR